MKARTSCFLALSLVGLPLFAQAVPPAQAAVPAEAASTQRPHADCNVCHLPHAPAGSTSLLAKDADSICAGCHLSAERPASVSAERAQHLSAPAESFASQHLWKDKGRWSRASLAGRQASKDGVCMACHEPHERDWAGPEPVKSLARKAYSPEGMLVPGRPTSEADVCFGCHGGQAINRRGQDGSTVGAYFSGAATSTHRLGSIGRPDLPSMRRTSMTPLTCSSCHSGSADSGLRGPHASRFPHLLNAAYEERDGMPESLATYAFCYQCHERSSILANESFTFHRQHITGQFLSLPGAPEPRTGSSKKKPGQDLGQPPGFTQGRRSPFRPQGLPGGVSIPSSCGVCHDAHGSLSYRALIRFDPRVVGPNNRGLLLFNYGGSHTGSCNLECHGYDHVDAKY